MLYCHKIQFSTTLSTVVYLIYRGNGDCLDVGYGGWATENTDISGEWRLQPGLSLLAFETLNKCGFLSTNVCACTTMHEDIKVKSGPAGIFADQTSLVCLKIDLYYSWA
jgi:hypothetical protein